MLAVIPKIWLSKEIEEMETDLSDAAVVIVKPSVELVKKCFLRLLPVFEMNTDFSGEEACEVYANLLEGYSDEQVAQAFKVCGQTLRRFPYPADLIDAMKS
jgi:hypothetical protein